MMTTRLFSHRIRYLILFALFLFTTWQTYKYARYYNSTKDTSNRKNGSVLESIKESTNKSHVTVSVYYEALCPDSRSFFIRHLLPTYLRLQNALRIELIPYGKAKTRQIDDDHFTFDCQHGTVECFANKIHSCAIHFIENTTLLLRFVTCMIDNNEDPESIGSECAQKFDIQWKPIFSCASTAQGNWLLKKHGEETNLLDPPMSFVPTILLNKNHHNQALILKNLYEAICSNYHDEIGKSCKN